MMVESLKVLVQRRAAAASQAGCVSQGGGQQTRSTASTLRFWDWLCCSVAKICEYFSMKQLRPEKDRGQKHLEYWISVRNFWSVKLRAVFLLARNLTWFVSLISRRLSPLSPLALLGRVRYFIFFGWKPAPVINQWANIFRHKTEYCLSFPFNLKSNFQPQ